MAGDGRGVLGALPLVVGVAAGVRGPGGMTHEENAGWIDPDVPGMGGRPAEGARNVVGRPGVTRVAAQTVADIDADDTVASEKDRHVRIDHVGSIAVPIRTKAPP